MSHKRAKACVNRGRSVPALLYCTITSAASPLPLAGLSSASCNPSGIGGISFPTSLALNSAQCRNRTRLLMRDSPRVPIFVSIASLTLLATFRRREGSRSSVSSFCNVPAGAGRKISNDIVSSKSFKKSWFVAARGASCDEAKLSAGVISEVADEVHVRMSSMSWSRSSAKCKAGSVSKIFSQVSRAHQEK
jgi:hypothetical protein